MASADLLSETKACDLLARIFRGRGYRIVRNIPFREYGVSFHIDGWDAKARVGFEFLTSQDEDHDDLTLDEYQALMTAQLKGELALFILDEVEPLSPADLRRSAEEFLDEVAAASKAKRSRRSGGKKPAKRASPRGTSAAGRAVAKAAGKAGRSTRGRASKPKPRKATPRTATKALAKKPRAKNRAR